jgi:CubicO group peptidase (beta-lactamase class C family)
MTETALADAVDGVAAAEEFSGVVDVQGDGLRFARAYGLADRAHGLPNMLETQFAIASGTKGLTALTVVSLIEERMFELTTTARTFLGNDLPLIDDDVTIEQLLAHRSGIGDYYDEEVHPDPTAYVMPVPVHQLATTVQYVAVLDGHAPQFAPGERFKYSNSGYVVLALIAERASGVPFHALVRERVCRRAGMADTAFLRSDELPGRAALGYLWNERFRTNVLHLPVRGSGDGGLYSTIADLAALWRALFAGGIVSTERVREVTRPRSETGRRRYGLGFWLDRETSAVMLEGADAGVSFQSVHDPTRQLTWSVVSNTTGGAWPLVRLLTEYLAD